MVAATLTAAQSQAQEARRRLKDIAADASLRQGHADFELQRLRATLKDVVADKACLLSEVQAKDRLVCTLTARCAALRDALAAAPTLAAQVSLCKVDGGWGGGQRGV